MTRLFIFPGLFVFFTLSSTLIIHIFRNEMAAKVQAEFAVRCGSCHWFWRQCQKRTQTRLNGRLHLERASLCCLSGLDSSVLPLGLNHAKHFSPVALYCIRSVLIISQDYFLTAKFRTALFISFHSVICILAALNFGSLVPNTARFRASSCRLFMYPYLSHPRYVAEVDSYLIFLGALGLVIVFLVYVC